MSYFFPSITPKWYVPNLTYIMKKHEIRAQKSPTPREGSNDRSWDAAKFSTVLKRNGAEFWIERGHDRMQHF